jgi:hypothetical protein
MGVVSMPNSPRPSRTQGVPSRRFILLRTSNITKSETLPFGIKLTWFENGQERGFCRKTNGPRRLRNPLRAATGIGHPHCFTGGPCG